jgi:large subunit ribosomal protein L23
MTVLDIFKNKKKKAERKNINEKKVEEKREEKDSVTSTALPVIPVEKEKKIQIKGKVVLEGASSALLINPYLSEKSTILRDTENKYIFKVSSKATKNEIKKLLENIYNIEVMKINVINTPSKLKRWRQKKTYFRSTKKMMVTIKEGQKIELGI